MKNDEITEHFLWTTRLEPVIGHLTAPERSTLRHALLLAFKAHDGQTRRSGEPFITHPVEVTRILAEIRCEVVRASPPVSPLSNCGFRTAA